MNKAASTAITIIGAAAALIAVYKFFKEEAAAAAAAVGEAIDPTSDKNLAYSGVNAVGASISGDKDFSLGGWLYDITHPPAEQKTTFVPRANQVRAESTYFENLIGH